MSRRAAITDTLDGADRALLNLLALHLRLSLPGVDGDMKSQVFGQDGVPTRDEFMRVLDAYRDSLPRSPS